MHEMRIEASYMKSRMNSPRLSSYYIQLYLPKINTTCFEHNNSSCFTLLDFGISWSFSQLQNAHDIRMKRAAKVVSMFNPLHIRTKIFDLLAINAFDIMFLKLFQMFVPFHWLLSNFFQI